MKAFQSRFTLRAAAAFCLAAALPASAVYAADATGVWINDTGRGAVEIKPCGTALCGHVVWVKDGGDAKGCGRQIIGDAQPAQAGTWDSGWIYSPERKKRYDVELKPLDENRLRVTGYAGSKFFSKTMIWKRAPADLERCGATLAKAETSAAARPGPDSKAEQPALATATPRQAIEPAATPSTPSPEVAPSKSPSPEARLRAELKKEADEAKAASAKAEEPQVAAADEAETASAAGPDLGGLKLDKYLKRTDGKCQLDLPWVKVDFKCPE